MQPLDGTKIAADILERLSNLPKPKKFIAGILVGESPVSASFQRLKQKTAERLGLDYRIYDFPATETNDTLRRKIGAIVNHTTCGGALIQLPLPAHLNAGYLLNAIPQSKDIDVLAERSLGAFYAGRSAVLPPAAGVVEELVRVTDFPLATSTVAVVGPGLLIGRPVATWLMRRCKELLIFYRESDYALLKNADLIVSGVGTASLLRPDMLKDGASVIDFGYGANGEGRLAGDFDAPSRSGNASSFYTPTPGGTGPILVAKLFENFFLLNSKRKD